MVKILKQPNAPAMQYYKKKYDKFAGVDFSTDGATVADKRSPDALNMISDSGGFPVKRRGWRVLATLDGAINGIFYYADNHYLIHAGEKIYSFIDGTPTEILTGVNNAKSTGFLYDAYLYLLTGNEYLRYDGTSIAAVVGYIPTIVIAAQPATGGGTTLSGVNLIATGRRVTYIADGTTLYKLPEQNIVGVQSVSVNNEAVSNYTVDTTAGTVTFASAPAAPEISGVPNVEIVYNKTNENNYISKCTIASIFNNRVFYAGNPDKPNVDWCCALDDPTYIPDTSYTEIGNDSSAIMGYLRLNDQQAIIKEDNQQDSSIFMRSYELNDTQAIFPVRQGIAGDGAISRGVFCILIDDPMFLSRTGILAIGNQMVSQERSLQSRSSFVNAKLTAENLQDAIAISWNGYMVVCFGDHAYIADSRQKTYTNNVTGTFEYEWYYWDNVPARVLFEDDGKLFFGTADGRVCQFNTDFLDSSGQPLMRAYSDGGHFNGENWVNGEAITAYWCTVVDDDNSFMTYKTLQKKGCGAYLKTYASSSVQVYLITDKDFGTLAVTHDLGIFDFANLDFSNFTFNTLPQNVVSFGKRIKRYKTIQVKLLNNSVNQGFGVYAIERRYTVGNAVKR